MKVGVLALQGDFREHAWTVEKLGHEALEVRIAENLSKVTALIIPGGESTTIIRLLRTSGLYSEIKRRAKQGFPVFGICAGLIVVSRSIVGEEMKPLGLIGIDVKRNDYGRQVDSFETDLKIRGLKKKVHALFIRAPVISHVSDDVEVLSTFQNNPVFVRKDNVWAASFHTELDQTTSVHKLFLNSIKKSSQ